MMGFATGIVLAFATFLIARFIGFDRDRAFYPTILIVIASYYVLFAAMGGSTKALVIESAVGVVFLAASIAGFRLNGWILVAGLTVHGLFDLVHGQLVNNPGVPAWWPAFCLAYDVALAACIASLMLVKPNSQAAA